MVKEFNQPEIFYILDPIGWNQGFASETAFRMKELAMDLNIKYIIGLADIENIASQRVLEKIGYNKIEQLDLWGVTLFFYDMKL
jgi:ribosomal-protein-alanine N-acetyltransferase